MSASRDCWRHPHEFRTLATLNVWLLFLIIVTENSRKHEALPGPLRLRACNASLAENYDLDTRSH
jgi:hypothetical protein